MEEIDNSMLYVLIILIGYIMAFWQRKAITRFIIRDKEIPIAHLYWWKPPWLEVMNYFIFLTVLVTYGSSMNSLYTCLYLSILLLISIVDFYIKEIPSLFHFLILLLGLVKLLVNYNQWLFYVSGMIGISFFLILIYLLTHGEGIGGGDIKFLAVSGLFLGIQPIVLSFILGCLCAFLGQGVSWCMGRKVRSFSFAPYLCFGIYMNILFADIILSWYLS